MKISIYSLASGQIMRTANVPIGLASLQIQEGEDWIEGEYPDDAFFIEGSAPIAIPNRPTDNHRFDYNTKQWIDPRTLSDLKALKDAAINQSRGLANASHFMFQGKQIAVDTLSKGDIIGAHGDWLIGQAPAGWPGGWKTMDNSYVAIPDQATWFAFYRAMVSQGTANFNHAQVLKTQLAAANTAEEVESVPNW